MHATMQNAGNNIPLSKQVHYFNAPRSKMAAVAGSGAVSAQLSNSFFLIGIGGNDLSVFDNAEQQARNRSATEQQSDTAAFYGSLISNYSAAITVRKLIKDEDSTENNLHLRSRIIIAFKLHG